MRRRLPAICLLLFALSFAAYSGALGHGFVDFDDPDYARDNAAVKRGLDRHTVVWAFETASLGNWHPVTWLSLLFDTSVYSTIAPLARGWLKADENGLYPGGHHLTNILLHCTNVLLVFALLHRMTGTIWRSAFVAALFALHPIHVESVAWISERKDLLSMLFLLLAVWWYCNYVRDRDLTAYIVTAFFFGMALMSKPMAVTLPFVLLLLDYWPLRRLHPYQRAPSAASGGHAAIPDGPPAFDKPTFSFLLLEKISLFAMSAWTAVVTYHVQRQNRVFQDAVWVPLSDRVANVVVAYVRYLGKLVWPVDLAALYPNPSLIGKPFWSGSQVIAALLLLIVITVVALALARSRPYVIVGWSWFVGALVPVIGFIQIGRHSMADRYAYLPFIGLYIVIAWGVADLTGRWKGRTIPLAIGAAVICAVLGVLAFMQSRHWKDSNALFEHTLAVTRDNWLIHNNLAAVLDRQGRGEEALQQLRRALEIYPDCAWMYDHLGSIYTRHGRLHDAQTAFQKAIEVDPMFHKAHYDLGLIYVNRGRPADALPHFRRAVELKPDHAEWRKGLGLLLGTLEDYDGAIAEFDEAKRLDPAMQSEIDELIAHHRAEAARRRR
jgi:Flp pilus assembly protein TadD